MIESEGYVVVPSLLIKNNSGFFAPQLLWPEEKLAATALFPYMASDLSRSSKGSG